VYPNFLLPLESQDPELIVDLHTILQGVYDRGSYAIRVDYHQSALLLKLSEADQQRVDKMLAPL